MGLNLAIRTASWGGSDMRWLASADGTDTNRSVTLNLALFNFASTFTSKKIPSGVFLGKVTASGLYGPYDDAASDGRQVARGILFTDVDVMDEVGIYGAASVVGSVLAPMLIRGMVTTANLPSTSGTDANGRADLTFVQFI